MKGSVLTDMKENKDDQIFNRTSKRKLKKGMFGYKYKVGLVFGYKLMNIKWTSVEILLVHVRSVYFRF